MAVLTKGLVTLAVFGACSSQLGQARELKNLVNFAPCFPFCGGSDAGVSIDPSAAMPPPGTPSHTYSNGGSTVTVSGDGSGTSVVSQNGRTYVNGQLVSPAPPVNTAVTTTTTSTSSTPSAPAPAPTSYSSTTASQSGPAPPTSQTASAAAPSQSS